MVPYRGLFARRGADVPLLGTASVWVFSR